MTKRYSRRREVVEEIIATVVEWILRVTAVVAGFAVIYIAYGLFSGAIINVQPNTPEMARVVSATSNTGLILVISGGAAICAAMLRFWEHAQLGIYYILAGLALYFGVPFGMQYLLIDTGPNQATDIVINSFSSLAILLFGAGFLRSAIAFIHRLIHGPPVEVRRERAGKLVVKPKERRIRLRPTMFSPCWKLPFCSESMREICPIFTERRPCWRIGRGCQCDPLLIETLLGGMAATPVEGGGALISLSEMEPVERVEQIRRRWRRKPAAKAPCDRCTIFLYHQQLKHQTLSPLVIVAVPLIFYVFWQPYIAIYGTVVNWINAIWVRISYKPVEAAFDPTGLMSTPMQIFVAFVIGMYLVVYLTRLLEFVLFKLRW